MKTHPIFTLGFASMMAIATFPLSSTASTNDSTFVQQLLTQYSRITSVTCDVRRDVIAPDNTIRWLSRVSFQQPDLLHAANASPLPRLVLTDGTNMFQHTSGQPRGFRRPIAQLDENMRISLERVPGTLMEHLTRLQNAPETTLEPTKEFFLRRRYETEQLIAILEGDAQYRLHSIRFLDPNNEDHQTGHILCQNFEEVLPDVWIAMQHETFVKLGENEIRERTRFSNYRANVDIPKDTFQPEAHYPKDIEWVDSFDKL